MAERKAGTGGTLTMDPWIFVLLAKMAIAAFIVVSASLIAERSSPMIAAMVATLPVSAGPVYVFLALEHGPAFVGQAALGSVGSNVAAACYCVTYVLLAQRQGPVVSILAALAVWVTSVSILQHISLQLLPAMLLMVVVFAACIFVTRPYVLARSLSTAARAWYAIPIRAVAVALLVAVVTSISAAVGPVWSGVMATFPIVLSSLAAILHLRIGGPATAAAIANAIPGLFGFGLGLTLVHLTAAPYGSMVALSLCLFVCIVWNLGLIWLARSNSSAAT
jgi:hypothetical protein